VLSFKTSCGKMPLFKIGFPFNVMPQIKLLLSTRCNCTEDESMSHDMNGKICPGGEAGESLLDQ